MPLLLVYIQFLAWKIVYHFKNWVLITWSYVPNPVLWSQIFKKPTEFKYYTSICEYISIVCWELFHNRLRKANACLSKSQLLLLPAKKEGRTQSTERNLSCLQWSRKLWPADIFHGLRCLLSSISSSYSLYALISYTCQHQWPTYHFFFCLEEFQMFTLTNIILLFFFKLGIEHRALPLCITESTICNKPQ